MLFIYKALRPDSKVTEGEIEAQSLPDALSKIVAMGLKPIILRPQKSLSLKAQNLFGQQILLDDKVFITKYLSLMLKVGTDLFRAIDILIEDFDKPAVKSLLLEIRSNLERGQPFYTTFAKYPKYFSSVFVNLVKSGEISGNLENIFGQLSDSLVKEKELAQKIKSSLTYPVILFVASILVLILLVSFSLPKIAGVFLSGNVEPPAFSRVVFAIGLFIGDNLWWLLTLLIVVVFSGWIFFTRTAGGKKVLYTLALRLPVVKDVIKKRSLQRFAATFSSLLLSGIPILEALEITAESVNMPELKNALIRISREGIAKGLTVGEAFKKEPVFPKVVSNLIAVSEKSGHLESILETLADFYTGEIEASVKSLVSFIEPILLLFIGLVIGSIALAIIIPVYQLTSTF